jgi:hypothetical protein
MTISSRIEAWMEWGLKLLQLLKVEEEMNAFWVSVLVPLILLDPR